MATTNLGLQDAFADMDVLDDGWLETVATSLEAAEAASRRATTKSVAGGTDVTLTADEAASAVLVFTGALTGNINVIVPLTPAGRNWLAVNATSGAFTLTVKGATGTGIAITQGSYRAVRSDGTNVVRAGLEVLTASGSLVLEDAANIVLNTTTGSKVGTATSQKLGFWNATPVIQPAAAAQAATVMGNADNEIGGLTIGAGYTQAEVVALRDRCEELADDVRALHTLVHAIRTALVNAGLMKGAA